MFTLRKAQERGCSRYDWLDSRHSFSFAGYFDPKFMGFGVLRVINEDTVQPGRGFDTHGHRDMEIISYVLEGALQHRDSLGNGSVIGKGDVQRMSAGTGVMHSEFNASRDEPVHFLQIWIEPRQRGLTPGYEQKTVPDREKQGGFRVIASPDGREDSLTIQQDALVFSRLWQSGESGRYSLASGRQAYVHVAKGNVLVQDVPMAAGDGAMLSGVGEIGFMGNACTEILLFDLAS